MDPTTPPQLIGHYRIVRKIGTGGMATVYEAEDLKSNRHVALKFLPDEIAEDPHSMARFRVEARAASALKHPSICTVYQVDEFEGRQFIAMELLEGQTLKEMIAGQALPVETALDIGLQVVAALDVAHANHIVHRDIKPSNVFVTTQGKVKLFDFGIAKMTAPPDPNHSGPTPAPLTSKGTVLGSSGYTAPEQILNEGIDQRTDIFAFGCVMYEMLTGARAFEKKSRVETMVATLSGKPTPISKLAPETPAALQNIVERCLEKKPAQRFQSAAELAAALLAFKNPEAAAAAGTALPASKPRSLWSRLTGR